MRLDRAIVLRSLGTITQSHLCNSPRNTSEAPFTFR